jgi:anti-sigma regulatory factor (Ser/Thr protein kinase)
MPTKRFSCSLQNLEAICDYVTHFAEQAGLNEAEVYAVQLAVDEATTNIIEHGYRVECPNRIDVSLGIFFMRKMMDEVSYEPSRDKGNILTMIKHHKK